MDVSKKFQVPKTFIYLSNFAPNFDGSKCPDLPHLLACLILPHLSNITPHLKTGAILDTCPELPHLILRVGQFRTAYFYKKSL